MAGSQTFSRTAWHPLFAALITENRPPGVEVQSEVVLGLEPMRADLLLLHQDKGDVLGGGVLRGLWPLLSPWTLVEFKSAVSPAGATAWLQLLSYGAHLHWDRLKTIGPAEALTLVLITPKLNQALRADAAGLKLKYEALGDGYYRVLGLNYPSFLVVLAEVAAAEDDPLLSLFSGATMGSVPSAAQSWLFSHVHGELKVDMSNLEGYEEIAAEIMKKLPVEARLAGMSAEERVAGLAAEERVAGLTPQEQILALPDDVLRGLSSSYVASLPTEIQTKIRRRLSH